LKNKQNFGLAEKIKINNSNISQETKSYFPLFKSYILSLSRGLIYSLKGKDIYCATNDNCRIWGN
jgi:hypothetical protein